MKNNVPLSGPGLPTGFYWFNAPPHHNFEDGLCLRTRGGTDFWQRTHYGFQRDDGHCLFTRVSGNFQLCTHVSFAPETQYDQCGLMVRADAGHWIKASTEYEDTSLSRLGSVVTNRGYSDWATQDVSSRVRERRYRVSREGDDFIVESSEDGVVWNQMRVTHLHDAPAAVEAGIYACSPQGAGFTCTFRSLSLSMTPADA